MSTTYLGLNLGECTLENLALLVAKTMKINGKTVNINEIKINNNDNVEFEPYEGVTIDEDVFDSFPENFINAKLGSYRLEEVGDKLFLILKKYKGERSAKLEYTNVFDMFMVGSLLQSQGRCKYAFMEMITYR